MRLFIFLLSAVIISSCRKSTDPDLLFSREQQTRIIQQSVRYSAKLAPVATHATKFDSQFDSYYDKATAEYDIRALTPSNDSGYFFLMTRKARSIWPAREAIGGKLKLDVANNLLDYEEEFRTWKMTEDSLNDRSLELFNKMVDGKDLTPYRSKYKGDRYIEFPDDRWYFNKKDKRWRDRFVDSIDSVK
ncbi:MAG: hypothetical protein HOP08_10655 [Cyclobacteriaceae bacterium]|nr:hypothetical protein [Cyclobacteriaceae bacterium]